MITTFLWQSRREGDAFARGVEHANDGALTVQAVSWDAVRCCCVVELVDEGTDEPLLYDERAYSERWPESDWRCEVANEGTSLGYQEWLAQKVALAAAVEEWEARLAAGESFRCQCGEEEKSVSREEE